MVSRLRNLGKGLLAALLGLLVALLAVELFLRLVFDPLDTIYQPDATVITRNPAAIAALHQSDPVVGYLMVPDTTVEFIRQRDQAVIPVRTNNLGFRDDEDYDIVPAGSDPTLRILLLGDSLVFGAGVPFEETMGEYLETALMDRFPDAPVQVMNWGIAGYGQEQERQLLEYLDAPAYQPDLVIVVITAGNDFGQSLALESLSDITGRPENNPAVSGESGSDNAETAVEKVPVSERIKGMLRQLHTYRLLAVYYNRLLGALGRRDVESSEEAAQSSREDIVRLMAYSTQADLPVLFVLMPPVGLALPLEEPYAHDRYIYDFYTETLNELDADWVDMYPPLIEDAALKDPDRIFWDAVHLTAEGNQIAAEVLAEHIEEKVDWP
jgi:lysophospholipase L1-like esterase